MTRKKRRLLVVLVSLTGLGAAAALVLSAFNDNLVFFVSPADLAHSKPSGRQVRLGGLVESGTVVKSEDGKAGVHFKVTDGKDSVPVVFKGILPDLFREGQGVVVLGIEQPDGVFKASEVLAKHDEAYMPKEVEEALKKSGRWNPSAGPPPPASTWNAPAAKPPG
jgi:cytochrome c-type biogenesis protein CcmE